MEINRVDNPAVFRKIWKIVFGDSDKWLDMYMDGYMDESKAFVLKDEAAAQTILSFYEHEALKLDMAYDNHPAFYAGGSLPGCRKKGNFTAIMEYVTEEIKKLGHKNASIFPAEEWLFDYYRDKFGFRDFYYVNELLAEPGDIMPWEYEMKEGRELSLNVVSAAKYSSVREKILKDTNHLAYGEKLIKLQKETAMLSHGNLYEIKGGSGKALCCIERSSSHKVRITEVLVNPDDFKDVIALIRKNFHGDLYEIRYPDFITVDVTGAKRKCVGQIVAFDDTVLPESAYAGFMFD